MTYFRKTAVLLIIFLTSLNLYSDTIWEGSAAMSRYGEFPINGFYGASNAFPVNTVVTVENPSNRQSIDIIIVNDLRDSNIFLLLSKDAAEKIDIKQDEITGVKVKIGKTIRAADFKPPAAEISKVPDPDYTPASPKIDTAIASATDPPAAVKEPPLKEPDSTVIIPEAYYDLNDEESENDTDIWLDEISRFELFEEIDEKEESILYDNKYVLVPAAPRPPEGITAAPPDNKAPVEELKHAVRQDNNNLNKFTDTVSDDYIVTLEKGNYLQLAAYRDLFTARRQKENIDIDYPVVIFYESSSNFYKLMAGPLKNDEKGLALLRVRYIGFKDAFIKSSE